MSPEERAELELLRDLKARVVCFGGDDYTLMPWIAAHKLHADEPYIGCPFCREKFVLRGEREKAIRAAARVLCDAVLQYEVGGGSATWDALVIARARMLVLLNDAA